MSNDAKVHPVKANIAILGGYMSNISLTLLEDMCILIFDLYCSFNI